MFANNKISLTQNIIGNLKETKKKIYLTYDLPIQEFKYKEKKCKKFTSFPNLIIKIAADFSCGLFVILQVVFRRRFFFSPLIWGDGGG